MTGHAILSQLTVSVKQKLPFARLKSLMKTNKYKAFRLVNVLSGEDL